jgi:GH25 family lysozyme M1 (1,4-beta-N-acetylmuramidase)
MKAPRFLSVWISVLAIVPGILFEPERAQAQTRPVGIDVSDYQSASLNWGTLKNTYGISFGWAKASEGQGSGSGSGGGNFPTYAVNAKAAGILIGAYHYARYDLNPGTAGATAEANVFWNATKNYMKADGLSLMPMLDVEASFTGQTKTTLSQWVNQWCLTVSNNAAATGIRVKPCIYISSSHAFTYLDSTVTQWNTDIANWPYTANHATAAASAQTAGSPPAGTAPWSGWQFWQYDDQNVAQAITTGDGDIFNGTLAQLNATMVIKTIGPAITIQPVSITAMPGTNVSFSVTATGSGTIHYQWQFSQTNIAGATASSYAINNVQLTNAGGYSVVLTDNIGTTPSDTAYLSVQAFLTNAPGSVVAPSGMVNWWPGDGNLIDIFGTANGTPQGGFYYAPGERGLAFHLDGTNGLVTTGAASLAVPWTVCMWVNRQNSSQTSAGLLEDGTYSLKLEQYNGTRQVGLTVLGVGDYVFSPVYTVPAGTWTHLTFVGTSTGTTLYANGVLKASLTNSIPLPRKYIGAGYITSSAKYVDFLLGSLDEIMTFNRALNATEISAIYSSGSSGLVHAPEVVSAQLTGPSQFTLNLKGQTGKNYTIYSSTNLIDWTAAGNLVNTLGTNQFIDNGVTTNSQKFYRVSQTY